jgi:hypothetical protein
MKIPEAYQKHLKILAYLIGSGLCAVALLHITDLPIEYSMVLSGAINYIAYSLQLELQNEGIVRHEDKK